MKHLLLFFIIINLSLAEGVDKYFPPQNTAVKKTLAEWQDLKFGLMMHWAPYSQWGVMASWTLCCDEWAHRTKGRFQDYHNYVKDYHNLYKRFNPVKFNPNKWAEAAANAGMKYLVFTTKHHDGFCMFDTKTTDHKITNNECPFSTNPKANITKVVFDAFREKDFMIGAYFSKPDWHSNYYWWRYYETGDRNVNYPIKKYPERWEKFKQFTYTQIEELMTDYGNIDILWLDGAQVQPKYFEQDIDMPTIAKMARNHQPGLLVVDRLVEGHYQNYLTPENKIPDAQIDAPWESCMTMADDGWSYRFDVGYKSTNELLHNFIEIIAKGGNLLLNIAPDSLGNWDPEAYDRLEGIGTWMSVNADAVYGCRPLKVYQENEIFFVKKGNYLYAFLLLESDRQDMPSTLTIESYQALPNSEIQLLGYANPIKWQNNGKGIVLFLDEDITQNLPCDHVLTFKIKYRKS